MSFFGGGVYTSNMVIPLSDGFDDGSELEIVGIIPQYATELKINLIPSQPLDDIQDIALHIKLSFQNNSLTLNAMNERLWNEEKHVNEINLFTGEMFSMKITRDEISYRIWTNDEEVASYDYQSDISPITDVQISSPVYLSNISYNQKQIHMTETYEKDNRKYQLIKFADSGFYSEHFTTLLPDTFGVGGRLEIFGIIPENADRMRINLAPHQCWDILLDIDLHFNPRFSTGNLIHNHRKNGIWGQEQIGGNVNLVPGSNFNAQFIAAEDGYKIYTNGIEVAFHRYQGNPGKVKFLEISSPIHVTKMSFTSIKTKVGFEKSIKAVDEYDSKQVINFFENEGYLSQLIVPLPDSLRIGTELEIIGSIPKKTVDMIINLIPHQPYANIKTLGLHINPRFEQGVIVCNSFANNNWGEETSNELNLAPGSKFNLKVKSLPEGYQILSNDDELAVYPHRIAPEKITDLQIKTPLIISKIIYKKN